MNQRSDGISDLMVTRKKESEHGRMQDESRNEWDTDWCLHVMTETCMDSS